MSARLARDAAYHQVEIAGSGDTIVLIHAGIADTACGSAVAAGHRRGLPGGARTTCAGSGSRRCRRSPTSNARDLLDLLDRLEIERAALVGNSLGGQRRARGDAGPATTGHGAGAGRPGAAERRAGRTRSWHTARRGGAPVRCDGELDAAADLTVRFWVDGAGPGRQARWTPTCDAWCTDDAAARATSTPRRVRDAGYEELELVEDAGDHADEVPAAHPARRSATTTSPTSCA